jgi:hypothetical protein
MVGAGLAALLAPLGLALTTTAADAGAPTTHQLRYYSVQQFVTIAGEYPDNEKEVYLSCKSGDFAVEGTWAVDHVDDLNPDAEINSGDERDVHVAQSLGYAENHLVNWWYFKFVNNADGNAQVNVFLTCLDRETTDNAGHKHLLSIGERRVASVAAVPVNDVGTSTLGACPANSISVAHGFVTGVDGTGPSRLYRSWPTVGGGWAWRFKNDSASVHSGAVGVDRCLSLRTQPAGAGGHVHKLTAAFGPVNVDGVATTLPASEKVHSEFTCEAHNSFIVAGSMALTNPSISWYLGNSPRGRTHAHRFWNTHEAPGTYVGGWCLAMRTGKQVRP